MQVDSSLHYVSFGMTVAFLGYGKGKGGFAALSLPL